MVIITETLTSTSHHDIFTYLDYIFPVTFILSDFIHIYFHIYIYIYIVNHRQTVLFYQNSSVWLDRLDSRSWDRILVDCNTNLRFYNSATRKPAQAREI